MNEKNERNVSKEELDRISEGTIQGMINTHWNDLHHSRNQDWQFWLILAVIGGGLATQSGNNSYDWLAVESLLAIGALISAIAAMVAWNHTELHVKKTTHILWLESLLTRKFELPPKTHFRYQNFKGEFPDRWFVGGIIFATYVTLAVDCVGGLIAVILQQQAERGPFGIVALAANILFFVCAYFPFTWIMSQKRKAYFDHFCLKAKRDVD